MKKLNEVVGCVILFLVIQGCASMNESSYDKYNDKFSSHQLIDRVAFEPIGLTKLLDPDFDKNSSAYKDLSDGERIDLAFRKFYEKTAPANQKAKRNQIQERILSASEQRCNDYKTLLQKKFSNANFITGILATGFGAAGAVVDSIDGSQILSALAAIASGYRAEYNQSFYSNVAATVIVAGIESRRRTYYEHIATKGQPLSIDLYPVEAAVKDAIRFHGQCGVMAGLQEASDAIRFYPEPGIDAATKTLTRAKLMSQISSTPPEQIPSILANWQSSVPVQQYIAGSPLASKVTPDSTASTKLLEHYYRSGLSVDEGVKSIDGLDSFVDKLGSEVKAAYKAAKAAVATTSGTYKKILEQCKPQYQALASLAADAQVQTTNASDPTKRQAGLDAQEAVNRDVTFLTTSVDYWLFSFARYATMVAGAIKQTKADEKPQDVVARFKTAQEFLSDEKPNVDRACPPSK